MNRPVWYIFQKNNNDYDAILIMSYRHDATVYNSYYQYNLDRQLVRGLLTLKIWIQDKWIGYSNRKCAKNYILTGGVVKKNHCRISESQHIIYNLRKNLRNFLAHQTLSSRKQKRITVLQKETVEHNAQIIYSSSELLWLCSTCFRQKEKCSSKHLGKTQCIPIEHHC